MIRQEQPIKAGRGQAATCTCPTTSSAAPLWTSLPTTQADPTLVTDLAKTENTYYDPGWIRTLGKNANPNLLFDYNAMGQQTMRLPAKPGTEDDWNYQRRTQWTYTVDGHEVVDDRLPGRGHDLAVRPPRQHHQRLRPGGSRSAWDSTVSTTASYNGFDEAIETSYKKDNEANWHFTTFDYNKNGMVTLRLENGERDGNGVQTKAPKRVELTYDQSDFMTRQLNLGTTRGVRRRRAHRHDVLRHRLGARSASCGALTRVVGPTPRRGGCARRRAGRTSTTASCGP